tara:strand:- start:246 stop:470 length:225 start_codon:yes stop_codon:yes gene_type:complete
MTDSDFSNGGDDYTEFHLTINIHDVRLLHYSVTEAIKIWPGSPARPAEEQEQLWHVRDELVKMLLEHQYMIAED